MLRSDPLKSAPRRSAATMLTPARCWLRHTVPGRIMHPPA